MKKEIGLWIDRREAIIVILTEGEEEITYQLKQRKFYPRVRQLTCPELGRINRLHRGGSKGPKVCQPSQQILR